MLGLFANPPAMAETVRERWTFLLQHLVNANSDAAGTLIEELEHFQADHGIRDLFPEAAADIALGRPGAWGDLQ